jgi:hypothetical protein
MNANELADALETMTTGWFDDLTLTQSATMLRQQQAKIEALKAKTLTDEEILNEMEFLPQTISMEDKDYIDFARAILRKAQEK